MPNILDAIVAHKKTEVAELKKNFSINKFVGDRISFKHALATEHLSIIGEFKRRSPSKGDLAINADPIEIIDEYLSVNIDAISVLTDQEFFAGSIQDMHLIAQHCQSHHCPVLRKDFILDPIQIIEAASFGASAVLLIVSIIANNLKELIDIAKTNGLDALVEVHNQKEIDCAIQAGAEIIGINNRDLNTFTVDLNHSLELIKSIPESIITVAESGIKTADDMSRLYQAGFNAVLIGETLMRSNNKVTMLTELRSQL